MEVTASDLIAGCALLISGWTVWRQSRYDKQAVRLNALLIDREEQETLAANRADVSGGFVKTARSSYKLRIFNRGKAAAKNVRLEIGEGAELFSVHELREKFPFPTLDTHQSVNINANVYMGSARRASFVIEWDDASGGGRREITDDVF